MDIDWYKFFYNDYMVELFGGLIFSCFTLFMIWFLRPKMGIAPNIASRPISDFNHAEELKNKLDNVYSIKIMNNSRIFKVLDLKFEMSILIPESSPKGQNYGIKKINLKSDRMWSLERKPLFTKGKTEKANYALIITVDHSHDLIELLKKYGGSYYELKVIAKNNFSGITTIKTEPFTDPTSIEKGRYYFGNTFEIKKC
ncbi:hypothetical protein AXE80_10830 [Wenyingzhuangia fucanilytica]|uniref:Uncharacterized protein n=1 Tax=Wenyingzhuangia fucanilytica TaxID=1790137 RepID=A0A1B1Y7M2_9FLAO|nr:hypothetical protein [Wenyingzhuangia fucanilytica]ANW96738.1 hypothetical protein AXE80_10830 [Wenyingzhuangia fucanilytica]